MVLSHLLVNQHRLASWLIHTDRTLYVRAALRPDSKTHLILGNVEVKVSRCTTNGRQLL
jgi:hypothetical protein